MSSTEISKKISGLNFQEALSFITNNLRNAVRDGMGDNKIARFLVDESEFSHIMFFDNDGKATKPSFCFN